MSLSKGTIEKLEIIKASILAQPKFYDQNKWVSKISSCGTTCCIAGWADFIVNGKKAHAIRAKQLFITGEDQSVFAKDWTKVARQALGISIDQAIRITASSFEWPDGLDDAYDNADTKTKKAAIAAKRIDLFISSGGTK